MSKFQSFQRQLNMYGFKTVTNGIDKGGYYHEMFLRGKPTLTTRIPRLNVKGKGAFRSRELGADPNFHGMQFLPSASGHTSEANASVATSTSGVGQATNKPSTNKAMAVGTESAVERRLSGSRLLKGSNLLDPRRSNLLSSVQQPVVAVPDNGFLSAQPRVTTLVGPMNSVTWMPWHRHRNAKPRDAVVVHRGAFGVPSPVHSLEWQHLFHICAQQRKTPHLPDLARQIALRAMLDRA